MQAKDFLKLVFYRVKQSWSSASIGNDWLPIINESLYDLFDYKGYRWLWQLTIQEIPAGQRQNSVNFQFNTTFPVLDVHGFFAVPAEACTDWITNCQPLGEIKTWMDECSCCATMTQWIGITCDKSNYFCWLEEDWRIKMDHRKPKSTINCGEFSLLNGQRWRVIRWKFPKDLSQSYKVFVEYYRGFNPLTSYTDDIQIPDFLAGPLACLVSAKVIDPLGQFRSGDGSSLRSIYEREMDMKYESQPQTLKVLEMKWY